MTPRLLLRLEGLAAAAAVLTFYVRAGGSWWLFVLLILAPDLSMLGYLAGPAAGAAAYNLVHTYVLPLALVLSGVLTGSVLTQQLALIWLAHIAIDRTLGFGLKYRAGFRDNHLMRL
jgi:uncharacterized membrane protein